MAIVELVKVHGVNEKNDPIVVTLRPEEAISIMLPGGRIIAINERLIAVSDREGNNEIAVRQ